MHQINKTKGNVLTSYGNSDTEKTQLHEGSIQPRDSGQETQSRSSMTLIWKGFHGLSSGREPSALKDRLGSFRPGGPSAPVHKQGAWTPGGPRALATGPALTPRQAVSLATPQRNQRLKTHNPAPIGGPRGARGVLQLQGTGSTGRMCRGTPLSLRDPLKRGWHQPLAPQAGLQSPVPSLRTGQECR